MGGAIFSQGEVSLARVTLVGNVARGGNSGVAGLGLGGGGIGADASGASAGRASAAVSVSAAAAGAFGGNGSGGGGGGFRAADDGAAAVLRRRRCRRRPAHRNRRPAAATATTPLRAAEGTEVGGGGEAAAASVGGDRRRLRCRRLGGATPAAVGAVPVSAAAAEPARTAAAPASAVVAVGVGGGGAGVSHGGQGGFGGGGASGSSWRKCRLRRRRRQRPQSAAAARGWAVRSSTTRASSRSRTRRSPAIRRSVEPATGGFAGQGLGGAIFNLNGQVTLDSATIAANSADAGGALYNLGYLAADRRPASRTPPRPRSRTRSLPTRPARPDVVSNAPATVAGGSRQHGRRAPSTATATNLVESHVDRRLGHVHGLAAHRRSRARAARRQRRPDDDPRDQRHEPGVRRWRRRL